MTGHSSNVKSIVRNIISISSTEFISRFTLFIVYAYLARIISIDQFGILNYAGSILSYIWLILNLAPEVLGSKETSINQNSQFVNKFFSFRILLGCFSFLILLIVSYSFPFSNVERNVLILLGTNLVISGLSLTWYYRGKEKNEIIFAGQLIVSILLLSLIIVCIKSAGDFLTALIFMAVANLISVMFMLIYSARDLGKFRIDWKFIHNLSIQSLPLFLSYAMINIYYNMDHIILGVMRSKIELGYYAAAYKILLIALLPATIIFQSYLPRLSKYEKNGSNEIINEYVKVILMFTICSTLISCIFHNELVQVVFGSQYEVSGKILLLLSFNIPLVYLNIILGNPLMIWGKQKQYSIAVCAGGISNIILNMILIPKYGMFGAAISTIATELFVLVFLVKTHYDYTGSLYLPLIMKSIIVLVVGITIGRILILLGLFWLLNLTLLIVVTIVLFILFNFVPNRGKKYVL